MTDSRRCWREKLWATETKIEFSLSILLALLFPAEIFQKLILLQFLIRLPVQALLRNLRIKIYIINQRLQTIIIQLRPYKPQYAQIHQRIVEVVMELMYHMHLDSPDCILIVRIPANRHYHGVNCDCGLAGRDVCRAVYVVVGDGMCAGG